MTYYIEPVEKKAFLRFQEHANSSYFSIADDSIFDIAATYDFSIQVVFRYFAGGVTTLSLLRKIGTGDNGGASVGFDVKIVSLTGAIRLTLTTENVGGTPHSGDYDLATTGLGDGEVHNVVFTFTRGVGTDTIKGYLDGVLDLTSAVATHNGDSCCNDGAFMLSHSTIANRYKNDLFMARIWTGASATLSLANVGHLLYDLQRDIRSWNDGGIMTYTDDPSTTAGCIIELLKDRPSKSLGVDYWKMVEDTSGNALHLTCPTNNVRCCWGDMLLKKASWEVPYWFTVKGQETNKTISPQFPLGYIGGIDVSNKGWLGKSISLEGSIIGNDAPGHDVDLAALASALTAIGDDGAMFRDTLRDTDLGYILTDGVKGLNLPFQERTRKVSKPTLQLSCSKPTWIDAHTIYGESDGSASPYTITFSINNTSDVPVAIDMMLFSNSAPGPTVTVTNLRNGKYFTIGQIYTSRIWCHPDAAAYSAMDDQGKAIRIVGGVNSRVLWLDGRELKYDVFDGEIFNLEPGQNRILIEATDEIYALLEWNEEHL